jgi:hypothetical protein
MGICNLFTALAAIISSRHPLVVRQNSTYYRLGVPEIAIPRIQGFFASVGCIPGKKREKLFFTLRITDYTPTAEEEAKRTYTYNVEHDHKSYAAGW